METEWSIKMFGRAKYYQFVENNFKDETFNLKAELNNLIDHYSWWGMKI